MIKILVTGSRYWTSQTMIYSAITDNVDLSKPLDYLIIEGECPHGGADIIARDIAWELGIPVLGVPAEWSKYGKRAGMIRNQIMINMNPDLVLAFPLEDSKGTFHTMELAIKAGINLLNYGYVEDIGMDRIL